MLRRTAILVISILLWLFFLVLLADAGRFSISWTIGAFPTALLIVWMMFRVFSSDYDLEGGPPSVCQTCGQPLVLH